MADIALDRSDQQRPMFLASHSVDRCGGLDLDRVTQRGPGAVGFEVVDILTGQTSTRQGRIDEPLLGQAVRDGQSAGGTVLVHRAPPDHRGHLIAVAHRVGESLEHQDPAAFAADVAISGGVKGLTAADRRQHPGTGGRDGAQRAGQRIDTTGHHQVAVPEPQGLAGLVNSDQRGTASGVDGYRRALEAERERDPAGNRVDRATGNEMRLDDVHRFGQQ